MQQLATQVSHISLKIVAIVLIGFSTTFAQVAPDTTKLPFLSPETQYLWPTNASDYMSATFGETRSAHFHAAIDVGTWGQRGFRVFASRDGVLNRVGVSPTGYGNVIYLKHNDGSYSMYAHLMEFVPSIREAVDEVRFQNFRADFNQNLEHLAIHFKKGDLIGFTGDTGIGPPHLHFELRTPLNNPFNPLLAGIRVPDSVPPRFASVAVEPIQPDALVNSRKATSRVPIRGAGTEFSFGTVRVSGTVGLAVDVSDRSDNMRNVYAIYDLKLFVNDSLYFHSQLDSFAMGTSRQMFLDRNFSILRSERRGYQRMFIRDGNNLAFYKDVGQRGFISLPDGRHSVRIEASDYFGNTSIARGTLISEQITPTATQTHPSFVDPLSLPSGPAAFPERFNDLFWTNNWISNPSDRHKFDIILRKTGSYSNSTKVASDLTGNQSVDLTHPGAQILRLNDEDLMLFRVIPGQVNRIRTPDQRLEVEFPANSLFDTLTVAIGYHYIGDQVFIEIGPTHEPLQSGIRIRYLMDENERKMQNVALYSVSGSATNRRYGYAGGIVHGHQLRGSTSSFGTFSIVSDTTAPTISRPRIYRRSDGKWFATVRVSDDISGINHNSAEFYVNDVRGIAEFDPFAGVLIYHLPGFSPAARNNIRVILSDRVGNTREVTFERISR